MSNGGRTEALPFNMTSGSFLEDPLAKFKPQEFAMQGTVMRLSGDAAFQR